MSRQAQSVAEDEIAHFSAQAEAWWNPAGPFRPLHRLNPVRLAYLREQICAHYGRKPGTKKPYEGLRILDVGCGGGLVTEPLARLGAAVTGLDAAAPAIAVARAHASAVGLKIDYRADSVESLAQKRKKFDVITALEIAEHVADLDSFLVALARLAKPGGLLIMSTLNRTLKSYLLGIVAAEHVLEWVPRGTHQWRKFIRPSELAQQLDRHGFVAEDLAGLAFNPLRGEFQINPRDLDVNYFLTARYAN